jgi:predicted RNA-binding protein YlqC (UPF0109 family)
VKDLVEYLARALVDEPEAVSVEAFVEDDETHVYELSVAEDDVGKVIGRGGRTVNAFRCVLRACAAKQDKRILLDVVD